MDCKECKELRSAVPYVAHEAAMARAERAAKRSFIIILVLVLLLVGTNVAWMVYESQFETVETVTTDIDASQDGGGVNIVGGGDVEYGAEGAYSDNDNP